MSMFRRTPILTVVFAYMMVFAGTTFINILTPESANAAAPYLASDTIGVGAATPTGFNNSQGITLDTTNHRMFVADSSNNRVLVFNLDSSNQVIDYTADFVLGQSNFINNSAATTQTGMSSLRHGQF